MPMSYDYDAKTVSDCAACEWDHENVEFMNGIDDETYFICQASKATVIILGDGTAIVQPKRR